MARVSSEFTRARLGLPPSRKATVDRSEARPAFLGVTRVQYPHRSVVEDFPEGPIRSECEARGSGPQRVAFYLLW